MLKSFTVALIIVTIALPALGKTHSDMYPVGCTELWAAVKDTLRNSGKYGIIGIDNNEKTASYNIGGYLGGKRINSIILNSKGASSCEMVTQTAFSGLAHNDAGDFKKRVEESLAKLKAAKPPEPGTPPPATPPAPPANPEEKQEKQ